MATPVMLSGYASVTISLTPGAPARTYILVPADIAAPAPDHSGAESSGVPQNAALGNAIEHIAAAAAAATAAAAPNVASAAPVSKTKDAPTTCVKKDAVGKKKYPKGGVGRRMTRCEHCAESRRNCTGGIPGIKKCTTCSNRYNADSHKCEWKPAAEINYCLKNDIPLREELQ